MIGIIEGMDRYYTHQRRFYPYLFGGALWLAWLLSLLLGSGRVDLAGQVVGTDYLMFYTAGSTLADGAQVELYDFEAQSMRQQEIIGPELQDFFAYINLPFLAWVYVPFAAVPYVWSFVLWSVLGLTLLWGALRLLGNGAVFPLALTFVPVFSAISFGQNSFVSLFLLTAVYALWVRDKRLLAGFVLALLLYKPQLVLGVGFLWLLQGRRDWLALVGFGLGALGLAGVMGGLMPDAAVAYFDFSREVLPTLADLDQFPLWHMHHMRGFWQLLLPSLVADGLWLLGSLVGVWLFWQMWRQFGARVVDERPFLFACAVLLTLWTTPHAMVYDWVLLLIPALLLWQTRPSWRPLLRRLFIYGWVAYLVSGPLTAGMLAFLPVAVQVSVLFYLFALWSLWQRNKGRTAG